MSAFDSSRAFLSRATRAARRYGLFAMVGVAVNHLVQRARRLRPSVRAELEHLRSRALAFDRQFGVETGGRVYQTELSVDNPHQLHAVRYEGSDPQFFRDAIAALPIDHRDFVFVDFGSGKGRAILLATEFPFKKIIGVEFSEELHRIAEQNIRRFRGHASQCSDVQSICVDAVHYPLPDERLVCYFFDPFDGPLMAEMLKAIQQSISRAPRDIFVVYYNPRCGRLFDQAAGFSRVTAVGPVALWRAMPAP